MTRLLLSRERGTPGESARFAWWEHSERECPSRVIGVAVGALEPARAVAIPVTGTTRQPLAASPRA